MRRTIVLLQFERLQTGIIRLESQDVLNVGASKRVDALRVVANNTHLVVHTAQLLHHKMLREIGVLILVDKNILEKILIFLKHVGIVAEKDIRVKQNIVKIHSITVAATHPITLVDFPQTRPLGVVVAALYVGIRKIVVGRNQRVFGTRNHRHHRIDRIVLHVELQILQNLLYSRLGVGRVIDCKIGVEAYSVGIEMKNLQKH